MNIRTLWLRTYTETKYRILLHLFFWLFLFALAAGVKMIPIQMGIGIVVSGVAYYSLVYLILPLYFKRKLLLAILLSLIYLVIITIMILILYQMLSAGYQFYMISHGLRDPFEFDPKMKDLDTGTDVYYLIFIFYIIILGPPLAAKAFREIYYQQTKALTLEKENIQMELNFLKSQVNPHFLFNTLNNIQSFIVNNEPEKSVDLIGKLSDLMRFTLYETGKDLIPLSKELQIIQNYIVLERVRCEDRATIEHTVTEEGKEYCIPPHILLPFVENAFKHGISHSINKPFIKTAINIENGSLLFTIQNSFEEKADKEPSVEGLGLKNVKRRLEHCYKNKHHLEIAKEKGVFFVKLEIKDLKDC